MEKERIQIMENETVYKAIIKLAMPMMLGMIVQIIYNLVDAFFVGKLNSPNMLAAVNLSMPLFMMLMAISEMLGNGGASNISRALGEKNFNKANKIAAISFYSCIAVGLVVTALGLIFLKPIVNILGANADTFKYTYDYSQIIIIGSVATICNFSMGQLLRSEGAAKESVLGMMIGTLCNILLNPIFIFVFKMGVAGSAMATLVSNLICVGYYAYCYFKHKSILSISIRNLSLDLKIFLGIISIGVPASLNQVLMSTAGIISNNVAVKYGDGAVAAIGVASRVIMIPIFLIIGLAIGCQPLIGYSYGAKNIKRIKEIVNKSVIIGTTIGIFFMILFLVFTKQLITVFSTDSEVVNKGTIILRAMTFSLPFLTVQMIISNGVQAMGKAVPSLILSVSRQGILYIPILIILNKIFGFYGFIYSQGITDIIMAAICVILLSKVLAQAQNKGDEISNEISA